MRGRVASDVFLLLLTQTHGAQKRFFSLLMADTSCVGVGVATANFELWKKKMQTEREMPNEATG